MTRIDPLGAHSTPPAVHVIDLTARIGLHALGEWGITTTADCTGGVSACNLALARYKLTDIERTLKI